MSLIRVVIAGWVLIADGNGARTRGFKCVLTKGTNKRCIVCAPREVKP